MIEEAFRQPTVRSRSDRGSRLRRVPVGKLEAGMALAKTLLNERGDALLTAETSLTNPYIALLREKGFRSVYVHDADTDDVVAEDAISEHLQTRATQTIYRFLETVEQAMRRADLARFSGSVADLRDGLRCSDFRRAVWGSGIQQVLYDVVESIIDEVLAAPGVAGLGVIKTHDNYTFSHSLDMAITAIMLGRKLHLDHTALRDLALGCLLHDVGKVFVDPAILNKPGPLSPWERAQMQKHSELGYELLRSLQPGEILANHVAYQHHERQDGRGYPRGLRGSNRVSRELHQGQARIMLIAEIAAVADVYDAQAADRPYRLALPPEQLARNMYDLAGSALNQELVSLCLTVAPPFPIGIDVVVSNGAYRGWHGVVVRQNSGQPERPIIRLLADAGGRRVDCRQVDLSR